MNTLTPAESTSPLALHPATRIGQVHLIVASLERQIPFYTQVLGFTLHWREGADAALGTPDAVLLRLTEIPNARRPQQSAGMYHFALLYPTRKELARAIARLFVLRYPNAPTDHGLSETTYLEDPEGNTIELYVRTLERAVYDLSGGQMIVRYANGRIGNGRDPLDLDSLFSELSESDALNLPLPAATEIGHMHLYVSSLERSMHFYADLLGYREGPFLPGFRMGEVGLDDPQPHVIAFNTWKGEGIPPAPENSIGLKQFTIVPPDGDELARVVARLHNAEIPLAESPEGFLVRDPSGIAIVLTDQRLPTAPPRG